MVFSTEVNLPLSAAASFVLGREHVVHKAETNPLEYHQLYTTYALCLVHNMQSKNDTFFWNIKLVSGQECAFTYLSVIFKPLMWIVMILSPGCFRIHVFLAVRWLSG